MNAGGILLVIAGVWVLAQVLRGGLVGKLKLT